MSSNKPRSKIRRALSWLRRHKLDTIVITVMFVVTLTVSAVNMTSYPQRFEDEGTYMSQAWAVQNKSALTHYTYWYDHPPVGWIQMAAHLTGTDATDRYDSVITAGREYMLLLHLATIVLLFALARRLGIGSIAAGIGTLAYALSPLVVEFSRYVLLDNVALPWLLTAFLLALSPRKHIVTAAASAACMAIAILSKETFLALLPVLVYALWQTGDKRNRRFCLTVFGVIFIMISGFYILYATLKNELFPGEGHVSLLGTLFWQLFGREGSGSIFDSTSGTRGLIRYWLAIDYWLLLASIIALPFAFFYRNLRVVAFAFLIGLLLVLRSGYLPYPYIVMLLPFAALTFAGVLQYAVIRPLQNSGSVIRDSLARIMVIALISSTVIFVAPAWHSKLTAITTTDLDASSRQAIAWIDRNISRDNRLVVESALWIELQEKGFSQPEPVWLYKTETDPAVTKELGGWQGIDYVILNGPTVGAANFNKSFPTVTQAINNAELVAEFGTDNQKIHIYQVRVITVQ